MLSIAAWKGTPGGVAADQITEVQVLVSQFPPNVKKSPLSTDLQRHTALLGLYGSISHSMSRQFAHCARDVQDMVRVWWLVFCVENVDTNLLSTGARSAHEV